MYVERNVDKSDANFRTYGKNFSAMLSKLHSTWPDEHFRGFQNFFPNVNAIGKHRVKKTFALSGRFSFHIISMAKNKKTNLLCFQVLALADCGSNHVFCTCGHLLHILHLFHGQNFAHHSTLTSQVGSSPTMFQPHRAPPDDHCTNVPNWAHVLGRRARAQCVDRQRFCTLILDGNLRGRGQ